MNVTIDAKLAESLFRSTIHDVQNEHWIPSSELKEDIKTVILGTHKTYRYILVNGILAKATNTECNPIVLQAGSELHGAFDARSLCHNVVVPVERELLGDRLGASNEPFLNKPARFPELATTNAVRRGNDTLMLNSAINVLNNLDSSEDARIALKDCIYFIFQRESRDLADYLSIEAGSFKQSSLINFSRQLVSKSIEGETCALLAGSIFNLIGKISSRQLDIKVHKVNQAGSSSNEVSDVDVYENKKLIYTAEVKDKNFTKQDVEHAVSKAVLAGHSSLIFLKGPRGILSNDSEESITVLWQEKSVDLFFLDIVEYFTSILSLAENIDVTEFTSWLNQHADAAKVKDDTFKHLTECLKNI